MNSVDETAKTLQDSNMEIDLDQIEANEKELAAIRAEEAANAENYQFLVRLFTFLAIAIAVTAVLANAAK